MRNLFLHIALWIRAIRWPGRKSALALNTMWLLHPADWQFRFTTFKMESQDVSGITQDGQHVRPPDGHVRMLSFQLGPLMVQLQSLQT